MTRLFLLLLAIGLTSLAGRSGFADVDCNNGAMCNMAAKAAEASGDLEAALGAYWRQADYATGERLPNGDNALVCDALDNLARLSMQLGQPLRANAWVQEAVGYCAPDDKRTALAKKIAAALPKDGAGIGGLYWSYAGYGEWSKMTLIDRGNGDFQVTWFIQRYGLVSSAESTGPTALWDFEGSGKLQDGRFVIRYGSAGTIEDGEFSGEGAPCALDFTVHPFALEVATDLPSECQNGGSAAYPRGTFWRVEAE